MREMKNAYAILVEKPQQLGRRRRGWEDDNNIYG